METVNDAPPPTEPPPPYKEPGNRLTRSTDDKVVAGVAGGLGRYFGLDPVVFRIAFVVLTLAGGSGVLLYLLGWVMIPDDAGGAALHRFGHERNQKFVAAVLAGAGLLLLVDEVVGNDDDLPIGLVLIGVGALLLWSRGQGSSSGGGAPPGPPAPPAPPTDDAEAPVASPSVTSSERVQPAAEPKAPSALVPVTLSLLAVLAGGLSLLGVSVTTGLALALLLTGGALIVGAWRGRARWLIPLGLVLAVALAATSVIDVPIRGGAGERSYRPQTLADIRSPYRLAAGELVLDLRDLDLRGSTVTVVSSVAAGSLQVVVPADVAVEVDAHAGTGELDILGRRVDGVDVDQDVVESGREGAGRLVLRVQVGLGEVEVRRALS